MQLSFLKTVLLCLFFTVVSYTIAFSQRKPERIIEKEEVEKFKTRLDSTICLYTTDSLYRKPILEIGNNAFIDSLIEYNLQEFAFYLNHYWYELDNNTALSLENTAPQEGYVHGEDEKFGFHRKSRFCSCGREHVWGNGWKGERLKSDEYTHYLRYGSLWWRLFRYNKKNFYNRIAQGKSGFRKIAVKRGRRRASYETNLWNYNSTRYNLDYLVNGFEKKEILEGNIGYLKCSFLPTANYVDERFIKNLIQEFLFTDALILDLREASFYKPESKFFTKDKSINEMSVPIWFVERFFRPDTTYNLGTAKVFHTREYLKDNGKPRRKTVENPTISLMTKTEEVKPFFKGGNYLYHYSHYPLEVDKNYEKYYTLRYYERPIYILTDRNTSDIAEWIAKVLQKYRNAIVIGEDTKGQNTITRSVGVSAYAWLNVPDIEISLTENEEDFVVKPNIFVSAYDTTSVDKAFDIAYKMAYEQSILKSDFTYIRKYGKRFKQLENITKPQPNSYILPKNAGEFLGSYGLGKEIIFKDGKLWLKNYQHLSVLHQTTPNTFLVESGLQKRTDRTPYETVAQPIYVFFKKNLEKENETDSVMNMFVRYGDFTSAKFTQIEKYNFKKFIKENQVIDTTKIIRPTISYPFSKMSKEEKMTLFRGFTMQRNLFKAFPNFSFTLLSENEILKDDLENKLSVFLFWSPTSTKSIEAIPILNKMIETYSSNNITFYGFTESKKKEVEEFLIGTPFYADIIPSSNSIFEDLYIPTSSEPVVLVLGKEGKFLFGEVLNRETLEKMEYVLSNQILK
ncbi:S41 family peptidase [Bernardetia sp.]|uniref:S41 family peptidase n=1 Tax=Bernardetia sp. TaxID=1937974 RepID=UPI0025C0E19F|nr:S41 family peptidase [Bernardetia sp.]